MQTRTPVWRAMKKRMSAVPCVVWSLFVAGACSGDRTPTAPSAQPGFLTLRVAATTTGAGAFVLALTGPGPITNVSAPPGKPYVVHARTTGATVRVAVFGDIDVGDLLRFSVPNVHRSSEYRASLLEVADQTNALRTSTSGYSFTVAK
jgi:hypothetical protein